MITNNDSSHIRPQIRSTEAADTDAARTLLRQCQLPVDDIVDRIGDGFCIAEYDGAVVGMAGVEVHDAYGLLRSVAIAPEWRNRSFGRELVKDRLAWARTHGLCDLYLLTTDAAGYFEQFGFTSVDRGDVPSPIKETSEFATLCPDTATVMVLNLK
jgi:amino-acid N-acetyltransferase